MLGKVGYGELGMIQSTVGMFATFAGFGLGLTATKHVAEYRTNNLEKAGRIISLSLISGVITGSLMALLLFIFAPWLAAQTLSAPELAPLLRISALLLFLGSANGAQMGTLSGFEAFKAIAGINLVVGVVSVPLQIVGVYVGGIEGLLWGLVGASVIECIMICTTMMKEAKKNGMRLHFSDCHREASILWRYSIPALLSGVMVSPVYWVCNTMLVNRPNGYAGAGTFNVADQWFNAVMFLPNIICSALLPILSERMGRRRNEDTSNLLAGSIKVNTLIMLPIVVVGSIVSPYIMGLYGKSFESEWLTLVMVLLTAGLLAIQAPVGQIIAASNRMWMGFLMNSGWGLVFILLTWQFIDLGALGLASARCGAYLLHATWTFGFAYYFIMKARS